MPPCCLKDPDVLIRGSPHARIGRTEEHKRLRADCSGDVRNTAVVTDEQRQSEKEMLQRKLDASRDQPGYADRIKAIEARLAELDAPDGP